VSIADVQFQRKIRQRTKILALGLAVWSFGILARLVQLQVFNHADLSDQVFRQNQARQDIVPERGTIYDRNEVILAQSIPSMTVYFNPALAGTEFDEQMTSILKLQPHLGLGAKDIERIRGAIQNGVNSIPVRRKLDVETAERIESLKLAGISAQTETKRFYPSGSLAAHVLGSVDIDNKGCGGVEYKFNSVLSGKAGKKLLLRDVKGRKYHEEILEPSTRGTDIVLTLDENIQYVAETELARAVRDHGASWGAVVVSHPASGDVLALANVPTFDPNAYPPKEPNDEFNRAIRHLYDPGSTFKIVTAAAAIENRSVSRDETFDCSKGSIESAGSPIRDHKNFGILKFPEVFIHSSNVGAIQIGRRVGRNAMHKTIQAFHFGEKTGIELPAEAAGRVPSLDEWSKRSIDSVSIGYETSATALQVLQAVNILANGGVRIPLHIVKNPPAGFEHAARPLQEFEQALSPRTARELVSILEQVVVEGTGREAAVKGYTAAGKTGTTQIYDPALKAFSSTRHIASFVGFVPVENPQISIIIVLNEPRTDAYYGGQVAAPAFREIARRVLRYLGIHPRPDLIPNIIASGNGAEDEP
jgi:cell division protein FtsI (penicillin-binding protein 3)